MKYINKNLVLMIAGFVLSLSAASAMAATINPGVVNLYATSNDVSIPFQNARLAQFDSSLGTLTGVSLFLEGTYSSTLTAKNLLPSLINKCEWVIEPYSMEIKSSSLPVSASDTVNKVIWLMGGQTASYQAPELSVNQTFTFSGSNLNPFTGSGFIDFFFGSDSIDTIIGPMTVTTSVKSIFTGSIRAAYSYTPAPLPSALIFLLSGLAGITGLRKFRSRASM